MYLPASAARFRHINAVYVPRYHVLGQETPEQNCSPWAVRNSRHDANTILHEVGDIHDIDWISAHMFLVFICQRLIRRGFLKIVDLLSPKHYVRPHEMVLLKEFPLFGHGKVVVVIPREYAGAGKQAGEFSQPARPGLNGRKWKLAFRIIGTFQPDELRFVIIVCLGPGREVVYPIEATIAHHPCQEAAARFSCRYRSCRFLLLCLLLQLI